MTRLVNEEQTSSSNSDNSCASSRASSQCFELDTSNGLPTNHTKAQRHQKRLHLSLDAGESDQEPTAKRIAHDSDKERKTSQESKFKHLQDDSNKPKRNPFCSRCRNHGKIAQVKGHKRHCDYRDCQCEGCKLVECRQIVSARQIKLRRNQKQDEEYGRRIEVSPPVLKRDSNNDSMSLFAKTLMRATSPATDVSHFKPQHASPAATTTITDSDTDSTATLKQKTPSDQSGKLLVAACSSASLQPALLETTAASRGISSTAAGHQQQLHPPPQLPPPPTQATSSQWPNQRLITTASSDPNCGEPTLNPALAVPFHLFNLSDPSLSQAQLAAAAAVTASLSKSTLSGMPTSTATTWTSTGSLTNSSAAATRLLPSIHEQISQVEEIHHTYGPLAIYAWLKYEHFNLHKIRDLIELSRSFYDNLLNLKLISHLGAGEQHFQPVSSSTAPTTTTSVDQRLLNEVNSLKHKNCTFKNSGGNIYLPTTSNESNLTSVMNLYHHQPTITKTSSCSDILASAGFQSSALPKLPSSPNSLINSYHHNMNSDARTSLVNGALGATGYANDTPSVSVVPTANHHNNMSLAVTFNSIPQVSSSDFLWARELEMPSAEGMSVMRPGHLFSRFMHYQQFSETDNHKANLNHNHLSLHQQQQQHHHHRPPSSPLPFVTNLSMQSSSSSSSAAASSSTTTLL